MSPKGNENVNPVSRYLLWVSTTSLVIVGISAALKWDEVMGIIAKPLILICSLLVIAYTLFSLKLGSIATVGHVGQIHHYTKKENTFTFYLLTFFYLILSIPTALYMASLLLGLS